jgi:hypothetical protein
MVPSVRSELSALRQQELAEATERGRRLKEAWAYQTRRPKPRRGDDIG